MEFFFSPELSFFLMGRRITRFPPAKVDLRLFPRIETPSPFLAGPILNSDKKEVPWLANLLPRGLF